MTSCVRILSTSSLECGPSLLLVNPDGTKILVNCPEGGQRLMLEHQQKLSTVVAVCCPVLRHSCLMGLPGWILTSSDVSILKNRATASAKNDNTATTTSTATTNHHHDENNATDASPLLDVYGPRGMRKFVASLHHFMKPKGHQTTTNNNNNNNNDEARRPSPSGGSSFGNVRVHEHGDTTKPTEATKAKTNSCSCGFDRFRITCYAFDDGDTDDGDVGIETDSGERVSGGGDRESGSAHNKRPYSILNHNSSNEGVGNSNSNNTHRDEQEGGRSRRKQGRQQLSFLFTSPPLSGKFLPNEAARLGVPKGPMLGILKAGQSVTFVPTNNNKKRKQRRGAKNGGPTEKATDLTTVTDAPVATTATPEEDGVPMVTVHPWQVVSPDTPGVAVLVLYYDTRLRFQQIVQSQDFLDLAQSGTGSSNNSWYLEVVVHMTPDPVWVDEMVQQFSSWTGTEHVWLSTKPSYSPLDDYGTPFRAAALGAAARNGVAESVYLTPMQTALPVSTTTTTTTQLQAPPSPNVDCTDPFRVTAADPSKSVGHRFVPGTTMMEFVLIPRAKRGWTRALSPSPAVHDAPNLASASRWIRNQAKEGLQGINDVSVTRAAAAASPDRVAAELGELYFTGTGSAIPCKHRNVTGMCVTATNGNRMLLDVGEGTIGQLLRRDALTRDDERDGCTRNAEFLATIRAVWISHSHADHHLGLLRLLQERRPSNNDDPVLLVAPACIFRFLETCEELGLLRDETNDESTHGSSRTRSIRYQPVNCWELVNPPPPGGMPPSERRSDARGHLAHIFGWTDIQAVPVDHCPNAFAVVLDGTPFGRLVYSGDCRPSSRLADVACPADVLVHEATFEDGMEDEAMKKKHSTVGEALRVADDMNASCVVLTHFSQRYPRIPPVTTSSAVVASSSASHAKSSPTVVFAFDYMRLTPRNLVEASQLTDVLRLLYPTDEKEEA